MFLNLSLIVSTITKKRGKMEQEKDIKTISQEVYKSAVGIDYIKYLFMMFKDRAISEAEALSNDLTPIFWHTCKDKVKNGELIVMTIRGEVRTGKSTVGAKIKHEINKEIVKCGLRSSPVNELNTIMADQTEFIRFIRTKPKQLCVQIDEYSTMAEGGANSSTEQQLIQHYSDVFAADKVHRINCNPTKMTDTNSFINLEVIGKNIEQKFIRCKLKYIDHVENVEQILGYVDIFVGDIIKKWLQIEPLVEKVKRTKKEDELVNKVVKTDWYSAYQIKKRKRFELLNEHGVRDVRELEFSKIVLKSFNILKKMAENSSRMIKNSIIITVLQDVCNAEKGIYSAYAELVVANKVNALIILTQEMKALKNQKRNAITKAEKGKYMQVLDVSGFDESIEILQDLYEKLIHKQIKYSKLYVEYVNLELTV